MVRQQDRDLLFTKRIIRKSTLTHSITICDRFRCKWLRSKWIEKLLCIAGMPLEDHATAISGERLNTRTYGKTFGDYLQTARNWGFEISRIEEARVNPEHLKGGPAFFDSVNGIPLDLVMKLQKPLESDTVSAAKSLGILPKKAELEFWNNATPRECILSRNSRPSQARAVYGCA